MSIYDMTDKEFIQHLKSKGVPKTIAKRTYEKWKQRKGIDAKKKSPIEPPKDYTPSSPLSEAPEGVQEGLKKVEEAIELGVKEEPGVLSQGITGVKQEFSEQTERLGEAIKTGNAPDAISSMSRTVLAPVQVINPMVDKVVEAVQPVMNTITSPISKQLEEQFGREVADKAAMAIEKGVTTIAEEIDNLPDPVKQSLGAAVDVTELIGTIFGVRAAKQTKAGQYATKKVGDTVELVGKGVEVITPESVKQISQKVKQKLGDQAEKLLQKEAENLYMRSPLDITDKKFRGVKTEQKVLNRKGNIVKINPNKQDQEVINITKALIGSDKVDITRSYGVQEKQVDDAITESAIQLQSRIDETPSGRVAKEAFFNEMVDFIKEEADKVPTLRSVDQIKSKIATQLERNILPEIDKYVEDGFIDGSKLLQMRKDIDIAMRQAGLDVFGESGQDAAREAYDLIRAYLNKKTQDLNPETDIMDTLYMQRNMYKLRDELAWKAMKESKKELRAGKGLGRMIDIIAESLGIPRSEPIELAILIGSALATSPANIFFALFLGGSALLKVQKMIKKSNFKLSKEVIKMKEISQKLQEVKKVNPELKSLTETLEGISTKEREEILEDVINRNKLKQALQEERESGELRGYIKEDPEVQSKIKSLQEDHERN